MLPTTPKTYAVVPCHNVNNNNKTIQQQQLLLLRLLRKSSLAASLKLHNNEINSKV